MCVHGGTSLQAVAGAIAALSEAHAFMEEKEEHFETKFLFIISCEINNTMRREAWKTRLSIKKLKSFSLSRVLRVKDS